MFCVIIRVHVSVDMYDVYIHKHVHVYVTYVCVTFVKDRVLAISLY